MKRLHFLPILIGLLSITLVSEAQFFRVRGLTIETTPANDDAQTQVLVRNSTSGQVQYRSASTLLGTTDLTYTASSRLLASSNGADATLPLFTSTEAGLVPLSGGGTTNFLRADGSWAAPASATNLSYTASTRLLASSTGTDVTLPLFSSTDAGLVPSSGGGTTNFLRADGTWAAASTTTLASGAYTPTITGRINVASATLHAAQYMRVGNVVTVSGSLNITPSVAGGASTVVGISFPVASNISAIGQCGGTASIGDTGEEAAAIFGSTSNDEASLGFDASTTTLRTWYFTFTYLIN